jgi:hypothetical protein
MVHVAVPAAHSPELSGQLLGARVRADTDMTRGALLVSYMLEGHCVTLLAVRRNEAVRARELTAAPRRLEATPHERHRHKREGHGQERGPGERPDREAPICEVRARALAEGLALSARMAHFLDLETDVLALDRATQTKDVGAEPNLIVELEPLPL